MYYNDNDNNQNIWLVVWNMFCFSIYWECHNPNWFSHVSEGYLYHQPVLLWKIIDHMRLYTVTIWQYHLSNPIIILVIILVIQSIRDNMRSSIGFPSLWTYSTPIIWVNLITTEPCSPSLESWFIREIIPFYGLKTTIGLVNYRVIYPDRLKMGKMNMTNLNPRLMNPRLFIWGGGTISIANDYCLGNPTPTIN